MPNSLDSAPAGEATAPPQQKKPDTSNSVGGCGCLALIAFACAFLLGKCSGAKESSDADTKENVSAETSGASGQRLAQNPTTFDFTPESFREAFNRQASSLDLDERFHIEAFKIGRGPVQDTMQATFSDKLYLVATIHKKTGRLKEISVLASGGSFKAAADLMLLPMVVVATADPSISPETRGKVVGQIVAAALDRKADAKKQTLGRLEMGASYIEAAGTLMLFVQPKH